ncbi:MAG: heparinase II/III family protein [Victivallales bacterium]|nr:heparinase II/III family protein [Victivallales bacterium]
MRKLFGFVCILFVQSHFLLAVDKVDHRIGSVEIPPPGQHPRLIFTREQLPAIRERAISEEGQKYLAALKHFAHGGRGEIAEAALGKDPKWIEDMRKDALVHWGGFLPRCRTAALIYQITGDSKDADIAVTLFRIWLTANKDGKSEGTTGMFHENPDGSFKPIASWGSADYALAYDWVWELLTEDERERTRKIFSSWLGEPTKAAMAGEWYALSPFPTGRLITNSNWGSLYSSNLGVSSLVIEGESGFDEGILKDCMKIARGYIGQSISSDGAMFEGMSYAWGFGTKDLPFFMMALKLRGIDLAVDSNLPKLPDWIAYETLPWGYEAFDINKSNGAYSAGNLATWMASTFGGKASWMLSMAAMPQFGIIPDATISLISGIPDLKSDFDRTKLPLMKWFSERGLIFCRDAWGERDTVLAVNTNPIRSGHTHSDQGHFCLASKGAYLIADSGVGAYDSKFHNIVHIDGKGQSRGEGCTEAFVRNAQGNSYADLLDLDLKSAYGRVAKGGLYGKNGKPGAFGKFFWEDYNPVERADRRFLFIRGAAATVIAISDDIQKDSTEHKYKWLARTVPNNVVEIDGAKFKVKERYGGSYLHTLERGRVSTFHHGDVPEGTYHAWLLVRSDPSPAAWASNNIWVNGKAVPYNCAYFGRGFFRNGWSWLQILPEKNSEIEIDAGKEITLKIESNSGGRIALAVFTKDLKWTPGDEIPQDGGRFRILTVNDNLVKSDNDWDVGENVRGQLDGVFLGRHPPVLDIEILKDKSLEGYCVLNASRNGVAGKFLSVMIPHESGDGIGLEIPAWGGGQVARIRTNDGEDYVGGQVDSTMTSGKFITDAKIASVSLDGEGGIRAYAIIEGRTLIFDGKPLVQCGNDLPFSLINDGSTIILDSSKANILSCLELNAKQILCRGQMHEIGKTGDHASGGRIRCTSKSLGIFGRILGLLGVSSDSLLEISLPPLPDKWIVKISDEGRLVIVEGTGKEPPEILAPYARKVIVNGTARHFTKDNAGRIYPALQWGTALIQQDGSIAYPKSM